MMTLAIQIELELEGKRGRLWERTGTRRKVLEIELELGEFEENVETVDERGDFKIQLEPGENLKQNWNWESL